MRSYWLKIAGGMTLVFVVGMGIITAARKGESAVEHAVSDGEFTIPLGQLVPFRLGGQELGRLRTITLSRTPERRVESVTLSVRMADSAGLEILKACKLSVADPERIDIGSVFVCLESDSGFTAFGELRATLRRGDDAYTYVAPLLLPAATVERIRSGEQNSPLRIDREDIRAEARAITDSVRASELEDEAREARRRADSLRRARSARDTAPPAAPALPRKP